MHFGENQLSRSLIGLSPLPTAHPPGFQPWWVRASTTSYSRFTLAMGRSPRFGSTPRDYAPQPQGPRHNALFGLAFATATPHGLTSPRSITRRLILQKARHHQPPPNPKTERQHTALTACRHTVSGTLSLPSRGTFHLSLTVLVRYRSPGSIQAYRVVPADSQQIPRARCYSGMPSMTHAVFSRTGLSPTTATLSRSLPLTPRTCHRRSGRTNTTTPHNPAPATPAGYHANTV
jgi:hypothetical protein